MPKHKQKHVWTSCRYSIFTAQQQLFNYGIYFHSCFPYSQISLSSYWPLTEQNNRNKLSSLKAVHDGTILHLPDKQVFLWSLLIMWWIIWDQIISHRQVVCEEFLRFSSNVAPSHVLTSPSLYLQAEWATWAPPGRPLLLDCALPCCGRDCAEPSGSWWTPANTGMCVSRGVPPAGHGSTFLLLPYSSETGP